MFVKCQRFNHHLLHIQRQRVEALNVIYHKEDISLGKKAGTVILSFIKQFITTLHIITLIYFRVTLFILFKSIFKFINHASQLFNFLL